MKKLLRAPLLGLLPLLLSACASNPVGLVNQRFADCPSSPNCVSSDATDADHHIEPFHLAVAPGVAWQKLSEVMTTWPRSSIVESTPDYLHAEVRSKIFRFVDDVEFNLRPEAGVIAVKSHARTGYSDFGVNRARLEQIRQALQQEHVLK